MGAVKPLRASVVLAIGNVAFMSRHVSLALAFVVFFGLNIAVLCMVLRGSASFAERP